MSQPQWKLLANLGDVGFADYGGLLVWVDETGVYEAEGEYYYAPEDETGTGEVYRFVLDRCKEVDGKLVPFAYDPETWRYPPYTEWFDDKTCDVSSLSGWMSNLELRAMFCAESPISRALAYEALGHHFGFDNLDQYPLKLTDAEGHERYKDIGR